MSSTPEVVQGQEATRPASVVPFVPPVRELMQYEPQIVLEEARRAAQALGEVIQQKPRKVVMNGKQYLEYEDWQLVGRFYGITAKEDGDPELVEFPGGVMGFKASGLAVDRDGRVLSRATAYCLNDEEKWSTRNRYEWHYILKDGSTSKEDPGADYLTWEPNPNKPGKVRPARKKVLAGEERVPLFQLSSMSQTRANAKALSNVLRWVVVLAGFATTPAEEVEAQATVEDNGNEPGNSHEPEVVETSSGPVKVGAGDHAAAAGAEPNPDYVGERPARKPATDRSNKRSPACPQCQSGKDVISSRKNPNEWYCFPCKHSWPKSEAAH